VTSFGEDVFPGFRYEYEGEQLFSERSAFQQVDVYDHPSFGKVLVLDGLVQTTERDEFVYHEMLAHVPLMSLSAPERVLVIGGGDGGTLRHVLMHPSVKRAVMVEIDELVTDVCRKYMPGIAAEAFDDPRAEVLFADGIAYVKDGDERFDAILIDSSDPVGPGEGLFTGEFYGAAAQRLNGDGVLAAQSGSPYAQQGELHRAFRNASSAFADVRPYLASVPTYPGTLWSFLLCGERLQVDVDAARERAHARGLLTKYWTPELQRGSFDLPKIARDVIAPEGPPHTWNPPAGRDALR
jgi:spermidine synthase